MGRNLAFTGQFTQLAVVSLRSIVKWGASLSTGRIIYKGSNKVIKPKINHMHEMQLEVEEHLLKIEQVFRQWSLPLSLTTLIARDPDNDNMIVVLTNEDADGLKKAASLATKQPPVDYDGKAKGA